MHTLRWATLALLSTFVFACGGGEVSEPDQAPTQPTDQTVTTPKNPCPDGLEYKDGHCVVPDPVKPEPLTLEECQTQHAYIEKGNPVPSVDNSGWKCGSHQVGYTFEVVVNDSGACAVDGPDWITRPIATDSDEFVKMSDTQFQIVNPSQIRVCITDG